MKLVGGLVLGMRELRSGLHDMLFSRLLLLSLRWKLLSAGCHGLVTEELERSFPVDMCSEGGA